MGQNPSCIKVTTKAVAVPTYGYGRSGISWKTGMAQKDTQVLECGNLSAKDFQQETKKYYEQNIRAKGQELFKSNESSQFRSFYDGSTKFYNGSKVASSDGSEWFTEVNDAVGPYSNEYKQALKQAEEKACPCSKK